MCDYPEALLHNLWAEIIPVKTTMASHKLERSKLRRGIIKTSVSTGPSFPRISRSKIMI